MSLFFNVGSSNRLTDSYQAGFEAASDACEGMDEEKSCLLFVFASSVFEQERVLSGVRKACPQAAVVGGSTAGEIVKEGQRHKSVVVAAISSESLKYITASEENIKDNEVEFASKLGEKLKQLMPEMRAIVVFPDILVGDGAAIVRGFQKVLGSRFPIVGGAPGDDFNFKKTYQYQDEKVISGGISAVGLSGDTVMNVRIGHGWKPVGLPVTITRAKGTTVYEINDKPAIDLYKDYFGVEHAAALEHEALAQIAIKSPLGLKPAADREEYIVSASISANPNDGSITCAAEIPEGATMRLMMSDQDEAVSAAHGAASQLKKDFEDDNATLKGVLVFNCIAREKLFGEEGDREIGTIRQIFGDDVEMAGLYTYGEIAPIDGIKEGISDVCTRFHNETVVLLGFGEKNEDIV